MTLPISRSGSSFRSVRVRLTLWNVLILGLTLAASGPDSAPIGAKQPDRGGRSRVDAPIPPQRSSPNAGNDRAFPGATGEWRGRRWSPRR